MSLVSIVPYKIFPAKVGGQKGIALFNEYLSQEIELICVTVKSNDPAATKRYRVLNILSDSPLRYANPFYFFTVRRIMKQHKTVFLLLEHPYYGWLGMLLKWFAGARLIVHSHNIESTRWRSLGKWWWKLLWWYERKTHRTADLNFFIHDDDRTYALDVFKLAPAKCTTITYGIEWNSAPSSEERARCKKLIQQQYAIEPGQQVLLFNGTLDYLPNLDALKAILEKINPLLLQSGFQYKIIICGRSLPAVLNNLEAYAGKNILYAGFVDDITVYFKGADLFINPLIDGGGIKTKLVEALGYDMNAVTTRSGAIGVPEILCGDKMTVVADGNWELFADAIVHNNNTSATPAAFYDNFYWGNITRRAAGAIKALTE